jgi:hypothetical protein
VTGSSQQTPFPDSSYQSPLVARWLWAENAPDNLVPN